MSKARRVSLLALLMMLTACGGERFGAREIGFDQLDGWQKDDQAQAAQTFLATCEPFTRKARAQTSGSNIALNTGLWKSLCDEAQNTGSDPDQARQFFERRFTPFRVNNNGKEQGLFTGYYEPVLYGARHKHGDFIYPIYAPPPELKDSKPYLPRDEIERGALKGRGLELVWVDDPVMLFFLHIQGSGRVRLNDGGEIQIGYADGNGQTYTSLGKIMGDEGILPKDKIDFFTIRAWLYSHPDQAFAMMARNPSYVFFKELGKLGAVGAAGVALVPQRSIAVDSRYIPYGLPVFMETELPTPPGSIPAPFHRLMIAQDTGGAIRGPVRADIFFGPGEEAEYLAGNMKGRGIYSLLVPKEIADQLR